MLVFRWRLFSEPREDSSPSNLYPLLETTPLLLRMDLPPGLLIALLVWAFLGLLQLELLTKFLLQFASQLLPQSINTLLLDNSPLDHFLRVLVLLSAICIFFSLLAILLLHLCLHHHKSWCTLVPSPRVASYLRFSSLSHSRLIHLPLPVASSAHHPSASPSHLLWLVPPYVDMIPIFVGDVLWCMWSHLCLSSFRGRRVVRVSHNCRRAESARLTPFLRE